MTSKGWPGKSAPSRAKGAKAPKMRGGGQGGANRGPGHTQGRGQAQAVGHVYGRSIIQRGDKPLGLNFAAQAISVG